MEFKFTEEQKENLKVLEVFPNEAFDDLVELLQRHMGEASVKKRGEQTAPIKVERDKFKDVIKRTEMLKATLDSLSPNDYWRLKDNVSCGYFGKDVPTGHFYQVFRHSEIDISGLLTLIEESANEFINDSKDAYGSRHADKPIAYLLDFWRDNVPESIGPISNEGEFVRFAAIVLDKKDDAMRNLIGEYFKRWPDKLVREELGK
jgi:hypothetical protein